MVALYHTRDRSQHRNNGAGFPVANFLSAMRVVMIIAAFLTATFAHAQNVAGAEGTQFGQQLLNSAVQPSYDESAGVGQGGSFNLGGTQVDTNELAPGVTREQMSGVANQNAKIEDLEQQGMETFDGHVSQESVEGDVARTMLNSKAMSAEDVVGSNPTQFSLVENHYLTNDPMGEAFADCKTTTTKQPGKPIVTVQTEDRTCTIGRSGATCGREREVEIEWADVAKTDFRINDRVSFNGTCENDVIDNQCTVQWECTDSAPRTVDGVVIDESTAKAKGLPLLFPSAPAVCWKARMKIACPVCIEDEYGNKTNCSNVDVSQPEGNSCGAYESNAMCRAVGDTCLLNDEDGSCSVISRRYSCSKQVTVKSDEVTATNACAGTIQCADGSCNGGVDFNDKGGMSLQVAMAQMVVADTISTDVTRDSKTINEADGSYKPLKSPDPSANDGANAADDWGFDQNDRGGTDAPPEKELTAAEQKMMDEAQLFKGNPYTCQSGYGGLVNCCKATDSNAKELFWKIHAEVNRENQAARLAQKGGTSGYQTMQQGGAGLSTLGANFTSMRDNVMGGGSGGYEGSTLTVWQQFMNRARQEIKPALKPKWACSDTEFDLAVQREIGSCSYAGSYCSKKVLGTCLKKREAYCCFRSPMSKMLRESAEPGGKLTHGNPKNPDCSGIPFDEVDRIDWSVMDFNQLAGNMEEGGAFAKTNDAEKASTNFTGSGSTKASEGRQTVEDRTMERIESINTDAVQANIAADAERYRSSIQANVEKTPARLSFANSYRMVTAGQGAGIAIRRKGSLGSASATVSVIQGAPDAAGFYSATVQWGDGEVGDKSVRLNPPAGAKGRVLLELRAGQGSVDGASVMTIDIK